jgi:hypothetical protein
VPASSAPSAAPCCGGGGNGAAYNNGADGADGAAYNSGADLVSTEAVSPRGSSSAAALLACATVAGVGSWSVVGDLTGTGGCALVVASDNAAEGTVPTAATGTRGVGPAVRADDGGGGGPAAFSGAGSTTPLSKALAATFATAARYSASATSDRTSLLLLFEGSRREKWMLLLLVAAAASHSGLRKGEAPAPVPGGHAEEDDGDRPHWPVEGSRV